MVRPPRRPVSRCPANLIWWAARCSRAGAATEPRDLASQPGRFLASRRQPATNCRAAARPHAFKAVFTVSLHGELLRTDLRIHNTGDEAFDFTAALHTYIEVLDIGVAKVRGLQGLRYLDKVRWMCAALDVRRLVACWGVAAMTWGLPGRAQVQDATNPPEATEEREEVGFEGPVDSVYLGAKDYVELDVGTGAAVAIASSGWEDVVVVRPAACLASLPGHALA